jgi:hypothetical protein
VTILGSIRLVFALRFDGDVEASDRASLQPIDAEAAIPNGLPIRQSSPDVLQLLFGRRIQT